LIIILQTRDKGDAIPHFVQSARLGMANSDVLDVERKWTQKLTPDGQCRFRAALMHILRLVAVRGMDSDVLFESILDQSGSSCSCAQAQYQRLSEQHREAFHSLGERQPPPLIGRPLIIKHAAEMLDVTPDRLEKLNSAADHVLRFWESVYRSSFTYFELIKPKYVSVFAAFAFSTFAHPSHHVLIRFCWMQGDVRCPVRVRKRSGPQAAQARDLQSAQPMHHPPSSRRRWQTRGE
jgi:hypothetical protein